MTAPPRNGYYALPASGSEAFPNVVHVLDGAVYPVFSSTVGSATVQWWRFVRGSLVLSAGGVPVVANYRQALATVYANVFDDCHNPVWHWEGEQKSDLTVDDLIICAPVYGYYVLSSLDSSNVVRIADGGEVFPLYSSLYSSSASWWTYHDGAVSQATNSHPLPSTYVEAIRGALVAVFGNYVGLSIDAMGEASVSPSELPVNVV